MAVHQSGCVPSTKIASIHQEYTDDAGSPATPEWQLVNNIRPQPKWRLRSLDRNEHQ